MSARNFSELLANKWSEAKFVCIGLDAEYKKIPEFLRLRVEEDVRKLPGTKAGRQRFRELVCGVMVMFNKAIIDTTRDIAGAYKPNYAFYARYGSEGMEALSETISYIHQVAYDVPVILDSKDADIGNTNQGYVDMAFRELDADAITTNPYLGGEALQPFLDCADKGVFVLCKTSNPGSAEFQDLQVKPNEAVLFRPLYEHVANRVANHWNQNRNCGLVVGATYPKELALVREVVGDGFPILIPGVGAQGGDLEETVRAGKDSRAQGFLINASRGIIFASSGTDFALAARGETIKLHTLINQYRQVKEIA